MYLKQQIRGSLCRGILRTPTVPQKGKAIYITSMSYIQFRNALKFINLGQVRLVMCNERVMLDSHGAVEFKDFNRVFPILY